MNVAAALSSACDFLQEAGIIEFRKESASLLAAVLHQNTTFFIAHPEYELSENESAVFRDYVGRRAKHEPFQYIVGHQEFYGLDFEVSPDVLIPRPETEILVECAVNILSGLDKPRFCEVGVGSGCISISILHAVGSATAISTDISDGALAVARKNARKHKVDGRFELRRANIFDGVGGKFDLIVSNPPYVPAGQIGSLQAEVRDHEPHAALDGGSDGLATIERTIRLSPELLTRRGTLLLEIGFDQASKVGDLFDPVFWHAPEFLPDLQGIPRIVRSKMTAEVQ